MAIKKIYGARRIQIIQELMPEASVMVLFSFLIALTIVQVLLPQLSTLLNVAISDSY